MTETQDSNEKQVAGAASDCNDLLGVCHELWAIAQGDHAIEDAVLLMHERLLAGLSVDSQSRLERLESLLYDGYAVHSHLRPEARCRTRTAHVSDVLDALKDAWQSPNA